MDRFIEIRWDNDDFFEVGMSNLDVWKKVGKLSVDEFMCLLFGLEPGTVKFDYGDPKEWPKKAEPIYRSLTEDIRAGKLYVFIDTRLDPKFNEDLASHYFHTGDPWWENGKLSKYALKDWLAKKNIQSDFFNVTKSPTTGLRQDSNVESQTQLMDKEPTLEEKPMQADESKKTAPQTISSELANNIYYLPDDWLTEIPPEHEFCINPLVPIGAVTLINAHGGTGKSIFALKMAVHAALGLPIIGAETKPGKMAYMALEDSENVVRNRIFKIFRGLPGDAQLQRSKLTTNIMIIDRYGHPTYMAEKQYGNIITPQIAKDLTAILKRDEIRCLFVDTFIRTNPLNENDNAEMGRLLVTYEGIAQQAKCGVVLIHHLPKGNSNISYAARGASAITDNARSILLLQTVQQKDVKKFSEQSIKTAISEERLIEVTHTKHNYSAEHPKQYLEMTEDGILLEVVSSSSSPSDPDFDVKQRYAELYNWWGTKGEARPLAKSNIDDETAKAIRPDGTNFGKQKYHAALDWAIKNGKATIEPAPEGRSRKPGVQFYSLVKSE